MTPIYPYFTNFLSPSQIIIDKIRRLCYSGKIDYCRYGPNTRIRVFLLMRAVRMFESSQEKWVEDYRHSYETITRTEALNSGIFPEDCSTSATLLRHNFKSVMELAMPERTPDYDLIDGAYLALDVYFDRFLTNVYIGQGMYERIRSATKRGIGGIFGDTQLLAYDIAGRLMFTFRRDAGDVTYIVESEDKLALGAGMQSCSADLILALSIIEDVTKHYDPEKFVEDSTISVI